MDCRYFILTQKLTCEIDVLGIYSHVLVTFGCDIWIYYVCVGIDMNNCYYRHANMMCDILASLEQTKSLIITIQGDKLYDAITLWFV